MIALFLIFLVATVTCLVTGHSLLWALLLGLCLFFALGLKRGHSVRRLWAMNFRMPELEWKYSYPLVILVSAAVIAWLIWLFKRKKWL